MNLRVHHYISILPLFVLLGIGNAGISAWLDYREISSSLTQESRIHEVVGEVWPADLLPPAGVRVPSPGNAAERLALLERNLWWRALFFVATALFLGILVAEVLTRISRRELGVLQRSAESLVSGSQSSGRALGWIREYAELESTLTTLSQILKDNSRQNRVRMLHHDTQG